MTNYDGSAEVAAIKARLSSLAEGRVYEDIPDNMLLERYATGDIKPFIYIEPSDPIALGRDRSLGVGEDKQPYTLPVMVYSYAHLASEARELSQSVGNLLLGWTPPTDNAGQMKTVGQGFQGVVLDPESKPSRYYRGRLFEVYINLSWA